MNKKKLRSFSNELGYLFHEIEENGLKMGIYNLGSFLIKCEEENLLKHESCSVKGLIDIFKEQGIKSDNIQDFEVKDSDIFIKKLVDLICKSYDDGYAESRKYIEKFFNVASRTISINNIDKKDVNKIIKNIFYMFDKFQKDMEEKKTNKKHEVIIPQ